MNVIKFDLEIKKRVAFGTLRNKVSAWMKKGLPPTVGELFTQAFSSEHDFAGNFNDALRDEWDKISFAQVKALLTVDQLVGSATTNGIQVFLFEKNVHALQSRNNSSIEVIAFGDLPVTQILNYSFKKIWRVLSKKSLKCSHIDETRIFIYPFDSRDRDIQSSELKIRADLKSRFSFGRTEIWRWAIILLVTIIGLVLVLIAGEPAPTGAPQSTGQSAANSASPFRPVYFSIMCSGIFFLLLDLTTHFIVPFFAGRNNRQVEINDLSSVVEAEGMTRNRETPNLTEPK